MGGQRQPAEEVRGPTEVDRRRRRGELVAQRAVHSVDRFADPAHQLVARGGGTYASRSALEEGPAEHRLEGLVTVPFLLADALTKRGAIHHPAANFSPQTVTDGRLVSGQSPQSAKPTGEVVVALLSNRD